MQLKFKSFLLALLPGVIIFLFSMLFPIVNPILVGLVLGIILGNLFRFHTEFVAFSHQSGNRFLEFSVIFLAFGINYGHLTKLGLESLLFVFLLVLSVLMVTYLLSKKPLNWMIGFGTAICGSSAIAALAPTLEKEKGDMGIAMAVVNLYGMIGMFILPFLIVKLDLEPIKNAMIIGGSLHSVGNVAGSGFMVSDGVGELSVTIKMVRVSLLSFGLLFFNFLAQKGKNLPWRQYFKLPWYIWGFLMITVLVSFVAIPKELSAWIDLIGKLLLTLAMTNIGIQIRFKDLIQSGKKGLTFGMGIWVFQLVFIAVYLMFSGS